MRTALYCLDLFCYTKNWSWSILSIYLYLQGLFHRHQEKYKATVNATLENMNKFAGAKPLQNYSQTFNSLRPRDAYMHQ